MDQIWNEMNLLEAYLPNQNKQNCSQRVLFHNLKECNQTDHIIILSFYLVMIWIHYSIRVICDIAFKLSKIAEPSVTWIQNLDYHSTVPWVQLKGNDSVSILMLNLSLLPLDACLKLPWYCLNIILVKNSKVCCFPLACLKVNFLYAACSKVNRLTTVSSRFS